MKLNSTITIHMKAIKRA